MPHEDITNDATANEGRKNQQRGQSNCSMLRAGAMAGGQVGRWQALGESAESALRGKTDGGLARRQAALSEPVRRLSLWEGEARLRFQGMNSGVQWPLVPPPRRSRAAARQTRPTPLPGSCAAARTVGADEPR